jgi:transaldolase
LALKIKIFADGADLGTIKALYADPTIKGFTTNPTLMRAAGVTDYCAFAADVLAIVRDRPVSFEVFADDFQQMIEQGREIGSWAPNVNVKIPVVNTRNEFTGEVIGALSADGISVNVTAVFTLDQVQATLKALRGDAPAFISIFAGRIADSGIDPIPVMAAAARMIKIAARPATELIWASPREVFNVVQADQAGCDVITATPDVLKKLSLLGKDQAQYSLETSQMFHRDAAKAGYTIPIPRHRVARVR